MISQTLGLGYANLCVKWEGGATIKRTCTGIAVRMRSTSGTIFNVRLDDPRIVGNEGTTHLLDVEYVSHIRIDNLDGRNWTGAMLRLRGVIGAVIMNPICSLNEEAFTTTPAYGILGDEVSAGNYRVNVEIIDPVIEGPNFGVSFASAQNCKIIGGTLEGCGIGLDIGTKSPQERPRA
ncbi:MAG TPA: hypothetical protein VIM12_03640 [Noviherbaspirillum sp.]|uniref:hypothetical protein n=1 Tax=Noviherbaspirillum sp. TaxID=1926288 RepID=UPI002F952B3B